MVTVSMRLIGSGELRAHKVGTHWRLPLAVFDVHRRKLNAQLIDAKAGAFRHRPRAFRRHQPG